MSHLFCSDSSTVPANPRGQTLSHRPFAALDGVRAQLAAPTLLLHPGERSEGFRGRSEARRPRRVGAVLQENDAENQGC